MTVTFSVHQDYKFRHQRMNKSLELVSFLLFSVSCRQALVNRCITNICNALHIRLSPGLISKQHKYGKQLFKEFVGTYKETESFPDRQ